MSAYEWIAAQDAAFLYFESPKMHMHIGGLVLFEDTGGSVDDLRAHVKARLSFAPRLRKRVMTVPFGQGRPAWVDDEGFDITYHIRPAALPSPASDNELVKLMGEVMSRQLDRQRPLWEMWLVDVRDGVKALIYKAHHAVADGIAGIDLATVLLDLAPEAAPPPVDDWEPQPAPTRQELLAAALADRRALPAKWAGGLATAVRNPQRSRARARDFTRGLVHMGRNALFPAPQTSLSRRSGAQRRFEIVRTKLDGVVSVKQRYGTTVNDVIMTLVAGGLRHLLLTRDEDVTGLKLRCAVPVSTRPDSERGAMGNKLTMVFAELPVNEPDPAVRLEQIHAEMAELKADDTVEVTQSLMNVAEDLPPGIFRGVGRGLSIQWVMNLSVTSIPGPDFPLYCLGGEVLEIAPFAPLFGQTALSVSALSYNGRLTFGLGADWDTMHDLDVLRGGIEKSLSELGV